MTGMTISIPDFWVGVLVGALAMFAFAVFMAVTRGRE